MTESMTQVGPITVTDVTGQKVYRVETLPSDATIDEVVQRLLAPMQQPVHDPEGRPLAYGVRSDREDRYLAGSERIGDTVQSEDTLHLLPTVDAGRGRGD